MSAISNGLRLRGRLPSITLTAGISAIIVKELRGRMRGRRAFIVLTLHVLLLAVFAWMFEQLNEQTIIQMSSYGGQATFASASVGRGVFVGLMLFQTLMVAVLAPAATAGAISSEREHQTLELLTVTPISSLAIVLGKLLSALAWVFVLILASIPITALVFLFGGVAPDDVVRGYLVLFAMVIGLGSVGIFFSTLTRRTGASTALTFVATLAFVVGSLFVFVFLGSTSEVGANGLRRQPPEALLYLNPFVAQLDVACGTEDGGFSGSCSFISGILGTVQTNDIPPDVPQAQPGFGGVGVGGVGAAPVAQGGNVVIKDRGVPAPDVVVSTVTADSFRDRFWPKSVLAFLVLAAVLTTLSIQFVSPTRRWRPSLPGPVRRIRMRSAP